jgi:hypothetical protein
LAAFAQDKRLQKAVDCLAVTQFRENLSNSNAAVIYSTALRFAFHITFLYIGIV